MTQRHTAFRNLIGLETEYAIRFRTSDSAGSRPTDEQLYGRLIRALNRTLPVVNARGFEPAKFVATGGAVKFETASQSSNSGLIEGATPECLSPRELLVWQRGQDQLLADAASQAGGSDGDFVLLKNNRDSQGNTYGSHENYDTRFATGVELWLWRLVLLMVFPAVVLCWPVCITLLVLGLLTVWILSEIFYASVVLLRRLRGATPPTRSAVPGVLCLDTQGMPRWFELVCHILLVVGFAPVLAPMSLAIRVVAFRRVRRVLYPFLISRMVCSGAGWMNVDGKYSICQKAGVCRRRMASGIWRARPMINVGNLLEAYVLSVINLQRFRSLWKSHQRMQVSMGDANMCEEAEYLRIATTRLVLDAIEAGVQFDIPRMQPFSAIDTINRGQIEAPVARLRGKSLNAIEIQWLYLNRVREYVRQKAVISDEVDDILRRWDDVLGRLEQNRDSLVGRVDWITKRYLIQGAGHGLSVESRRMIDLKYHELSPEGYYFLLAETGSVVTLVGEEERKAAMRFPPSTARATMRGRYVREFGNTNVPISVDWESLKIGKGMNAKTVSLLHDDFYS